MYELILTLLELQASGGVVPVGTPMPCTNCGGQALTAVTAAWGTQGYYAQADVLEQIRNFGLDKWAILAYVLAAFGGLIMAAMGLPYKMYLWFFIGPALFWTLCYDTVDVTGVDWRVGPPVMASGAGSSGSVDIAQRDMREVWRIVEQGLINSNYTQRHGINVYRDREPSQAARVSEPFAYFDWVISDTVQSLIGWTGVLQVRTNSQTSSNTLAVDAIGGRNWDLTSALKWQYLESITNARITNGHVREYFSRFWASECGDNVTSAIDKSKLLSISKKKRLEAIDSILLATHGHSSPFTDALGLNYDASRTKLRAALSGDTPRIPIPGVLANQMVMDDKLEPQLRLREYFRAAIANVQAPGGGAAGPTRTRYVLFDSGTHGERWYPWFRCEHYFVSMMYMLRWEAAIQAFQLLQATPEGVTPIQVVTHLFNGWGLKDPTQLASSTPGKMQPEQAEGFVRNLVLLHLFRNELESGSAQDFDSRRYTASEKLVLQGVQEGQRTKQSKEKFAEFYTWALMIPKFQGILLYILTFAFPFAAMMIVVPGWWKVLFQWCQFFLWVKLWDVGFAIVMVMDRSVYAMLSNDSAGQLFNAVVNRMFKLNEIYYVFPATPGTAGPPAPLKAPLTSTTGQASNYILNPEAWVQHASSYPSNSIAQASAGISQDLDRMIELFDRLMTTATNTDLDLMNGYYILIMAALYFAVPGIVGIAVLGAKSGMANMISSTVGGIAQPGAQAASQAWVGSQTQRLHTTQNVGAQEAYAKHMRNGLAGQVLGAANRANDARNYGSFLDNRGRQLERAGQQRSLGGQSAEAGLDMTGDIGSLATTMASKIPKVGNILSFGSKKMFGRNVKGFGGGRGTSLYDRIADPVKKNAQIQRNRVQAHANALAADLNNQSLQAGMHGNLAEMEKGRVGSQAEQGAQMEAWKFKQGLANKLSGKLAGWGVFPGSLNPGQQPTNMEGMAMLGQLGQAAAHEGHHFQGEGLDRAKSWYDIANAESGGAQMLKEFQNAGIDKDKIIDTFAGKDFQGVVDTLANGGDLAGGLGKLVGGAKPVVANPGGKDDYSDAKIDTPDDLKLQK